jgi:prevent-host-death family protein
MASTRSIGADEARTHFYRVLREIATGETITITKPGIPVAKLIPMSESPSAADDLLTEMRAFRKSHKLDGLSIRELIEEGRK